MADANGLQRAIRPSGFFNIKKMAADFCSAQCIMDNTGSLTTKSLQPRPFQKYKPLPPQNRSKEFQPSQNGLMQYNHATLNSLIMLCSNVREICNRLSSVGYSSIYNPAAFLTFLDAKNDNPLATWKPIITKSTKVNSLSGSFTVLAQFAS